MHGRLYLAGVERHALEQFRRAGRIPLDDVVYLVPATERMGEATRAALKHAHLWLAEGKDYEGSLSGVYDVRAVHLIEPLDADPHFTGPIDVISPEMLTPVEEVPDETESLGDAGESQEQADPDDPNDTDGAAR